MHKNFDFEEFMDIIRKLRSKDGCPWDREQTHESLKQCLIEECYEVKKLSIIATAKICVKSWAIFSCKWPCIA